MKKSDKNKKPTSRREAIKRLGVLAITSGAASAGIFSLNSCEPEESCYTSNYSSRYYSGGYSSRYSSGYSSSSGGYSSSYSSKYSSGYYSQYCSGGGSLYYYSYYCSTRYRSYGSTYTSGG